MKTLKRYQNRVITTPLGQNIGTNVLNDLNKIGVSPNNVKTIHTVLDPVNKAKVTVIEYTYL